MIEQAFNFKMWAERRTIKAVVQVDKQRHDALYRFMLEQLNHVLVVEDLFKARLLGKVDPHSSTYPEQVPCLEEIEARLLTSGQWYREYALNIISENERAICFQFTDGKYGVLSESEIMFHIVTHASYHRGIIARALDDARVAHPSEGCGIHIHELEPLRRNLKIKSEIENGIAKGEKAIIDGKLITNAEAKRRLNKF